MKRRLPLALLTVAALVVLPSTAASATGGHHGPGKPGYSASHGKDKPGKPKPGKPTPSTPTPGTPSGDLCGGKRAGEVVGWDAYTCDKATGYFLYEKLRAGKPAGYHNSGPQHRVALHTVWAWPTADQRLRTEWSPTMPRKAEVVPLALDATDTAAVCADPRAYGLQVDLVGDGVAGRGLDVPGLVPSTITPPHDGGFPVPHTLAFYAHYEVRDLVDLDALCREDVAPAPEPAPAPAPAPAPVPEPSPEPAPEPSVAPAPEPEPTVEPSPEPAPEPTEPTEQAEVLPAPADPTPTPTPAAPRPTPTERAEVLSAGDDTLAATGAQTLVGLLAAVAAIAGGTALVLARRNSSQS